MSVDQITYLVFGVVLSLALLFDLGLLSKKDETVTIKKALNQTFFWVGLALAFFFFVWYEPSKSQAPFSCPSGYIKLLIRQLLLLL